MLEKLDQFQDVKAPYSKWNADRFAERNKAIYELYIAGARVAEIAEKLNVTKMSVYNVINEQKKLRSIVCQYCGNHISDVRDKWSIESSGECLACDHIRADVEPGQEPSEEVE